MGQLEIDSAVASVTGERIGVIRSLGFSIVDPAEVAFDPEGRGPMVFDWDTMGPVLWPE